MALEIETPTPPDLTNRPLPSGIDPTDVLEGTGDLRRDELEVALSEGAWNDAFGEWTEYTDLSEPEFQALYDAGLVHALDFYWDPHDMDIQFELPTIPDEIEGQEDLASQAAVELADLGETVRKVLVNDYLDWSELESDEDEL